MSKTKKHDIDIMIDELPIADIKGKVEGYKERISEAIELALEESDGLIKLITPDGEKLISSKFMCPHDGFSFPDYFLSILRMEHVKLVMD